VNANDSVYYDTGNWNDLEAVQQMFRQRISGGTHAPWYGDVFERHGEQFRRAVPRLWQRMGRAGHAYLPNLGRPGA
jgi:hypothetical protein